eukprot:1616200-Alexandrium_andersonii.AAC.1
MSASLVGSEMCIRDSSEPLFGVPCRRGLSEPRGLRSSWGAFCSGPLGPQGVVEAPRADAAYPGCRALCSAGLSAQAGRRLPG